uniref:C2 domain-containing protein n=1 Tax=Oryza brachyantha TaxID=4533 RepID=J3L1F3_ORYBR
MPMPMVRRLAVEVVDARDLVPKDGIGTSSAYAVVEFDGDRKRTRTVPRDLSPQWHERLEFAVHDPAAMQAESLDPQPEPDPEPEPDGGEAAYPPEVRKTRMASSTERVRVARHLSGGLGPEYYATSPRVISGRFVSTGDAVEPVQSSYDLVEPMRYLFVRIVRVRGIRACEGPYVKIQAGPHTLRSRPGRDISGTGNPEWNQVFAINHAKPEPTLEISVWDGGAPSPIEAFLGGVCFDLSDVPVRDQPDGPLAPQWYRLEGGEPGMVTGDIMVVVWIGTQADEAFPEAWNTDAPYAAYTRSKVYQSPKLWVAVWIGTQADEAFPEAWNTDAPYAAYTRSKVYQSPKLWYLRASVIEAQDVRGPAPPPRAPLDVRVKIQVGFQSARTRRSVASRSSGSAFAWEEDLMFVVSEPLDESLIVLVEDRSMIKEPALLGHTTIPVNSVEQRLHERQLVASRWFSLEGGTSDIGIGPGQAGGGPPGFYSGRLHLRLCLEGGYHVLDEAAHVCSDYRPTAKQLWKPPGGVLELGIIGACGLLPMKTKGGAKGSTDAYCVAKYGKKWVRTRTVTDSLNPRWNEQYTWQVYDPCTVLTVAVFDNWRMFAGAGDERQDYRIGKVRVRVSTLESNRAYTASYPLLVLLRSGLKKMGEDGFTRFADLGQFQNFLVTSIHGLDLYDIMNFGDFVDA